MRSADADRRRPIRLRAELAIACALIVLAGGLAFGFSRLKSLDQAAPGPAHSANATLAMVSPSLQPSSGAASLTARYASSLATDTAAGSVVLFGGFSTTPPYGGLNDTWTWEGKSWRPRQTLAAPGPRTNASMLYDGTTGGLLLFGGDEFPPVGVSKADVLAGKYSVVGTVNDTWTWNGQRWSQRHPDKSPGARFGALVAYDAIHNRVVLFGGDSPGTNNGLPLDDTWTWDGTSWTPLHPSRHPVGWEARAMVYDNDLKQVLLFASSNCYPQSCQTWQTWAWDGSNWSLRGSSVLSGEIGSGVQLAYDPKTHSVVLFGGELFGGKGPNTYFAETWSWSPVSGWQRLQPASSPPAMDYTQAAMTFDASSGTVILFAPGNGFWRWNGKTWAPSES